MENKNYMEQVAKILGVELNEEFEVDDHDRLFKFTEQYLMHSDKYGVWQIDTDALGEILSGDYKIIKKPWKPHDSDKFFYITISGDIVEKEYVKIIPYDCTLIRMGNCFKTKEEAESHKEKWLKYFWQEPDVSWRNNNE